MVAPEFVVSPEFEDLTPSFSFYVSLVGVKWGYPVTALLKIASNNNTKTNIKQFWIITKGRNDL